MKSITSLRFCSLVLSVLLIAACGENKVASKQDSLNIPSPSEMSVDIEVNGRVSTLNHIDITHLGKQIPYTYSDGKIANSPGYDWWVSKHFAIKSDLPFGKVKLYLELLEMSYPHYVELFGQQPPNIERQRIAVVYGSSRAKVKDAMFDDGFLRGVHQHAGGETMYYNRAGYSFPSHREQHQRYIVIHETMHAFHMALNGHSTWAPYWITEGLADSIAHHVYDSNKNQLTVMVFDRAPMNYVETGLKQYEELNQPSMEQINAHPTLKRGLNFLMIHYLLADPELNHKFKLFIAKLMAANPHSDQTVPVTNDLLKSVYQNWEKLEQGFTQFVEDTQSSFKIVNGPWEQDGNSYWIRQYDHNKTAQLNIAVSATQKPNAHSRRFDFPAPTAPAALKLSNPTDIGFVLNYLPEHRRRGGNGIGFRLATGSELFEIMIIEGRVLQINNGFVQNAKQSYAIDETLIGAIDGSNNLNVAVTFDYERLVVTLSSGTVYQEIPVVLNEVSLSALQKAELALLATNNNNRITPYFQEHRAEQLKRELGGSNIFGIKRSKQLSAVMALCNASDCQSSLKQVYNLIESNQPAQADRLISSVYDTLYLSPTSEQLLYPPLDASIEYHEKRPFVRIDNLLKRQTGKLDISYYDQTGLKLTTGSYDITLASGPNNIDITPHHKARYLQASINVENGLGLSNKTRIAPIQPFDGVEMAIKPSYNQVTVTLSGPYSGRTEGQLVVRLLRTNGSHQNIGNKAVVIAPYQVIDFDFELGSSVADQKWLIEATAILNVDGEDIKITKTQAI